MAKKIKDKAIGIKNIAVKPDPSALPNSAPKKIKEIKELDKLKLESTREKIENGLKADTGKREPDFKVLEGATVVKKEEEGGEK